MYVYIFITVLFFANFNCTNNVAKQLQRGEFSHTTLYL